MEKVGLFGVDPMRIIALIIGTLVLLKKLFAPTWLSEDNIAAINDWLLLAMPFLMAEAARLFVVPTAKVEAVVSTSTAQQIYNVTSSTPKAAVWLIALVIGGMSVSGCSVSIKERVVTGYQGTQVALEAVHDAERQVFNSKSIPQLTPNAQDRVLGILDKAFAAQQRAGAALLVWEPGAPVPGDVMAWLTAADQLIPEIEAVVPELAGRLVVAQDLIAWAKAIVRITELLNITPPARVKALALQGGM